MHTKRRTFRKRDAGGRLDRGSELERLRCNEQAPDSKKMGILQRLEHRHGPRAGLWSQDSLPRVNEVFRYDRAPVRPASLLAQVEAKTPMVRALLVALCDPLNRVKIARMLLDEPLEKIGDEAPARLLADEARIEVLGLITVVYIQCAQRVTVPGNRPVEAWLGVVAAGSKESGHRQVRAQPPAHVLR